MKEWQLFKTLTFDEENNSFEYDNLDFTDFYFICTGIKNSTEVQSSLNIHINDILTIKIDSQNKNGTNDKNQQLFIKYNGLFWEIYKLAQSNNNDEMYTIQYSSVLMPYVQKLNVGKCRKITFNNLQYPVVSGTVQIYAR